MTKQMAATLDKIFERNPKNSGALITVLQDIQREFHAFIERSAVGVCTSVGEG